MFLLKVGGVGQAAAASAGPVTLGSVANRLKQKVQASIPSREAVGPLADSALGLISTLAVAREATPGDTTLATVAKEAGKKGKGPESRRLAAIVQLACSTTPEATFTGNSVTYNSALAKTLVPNFLASTEFKGDEANKDPNVAATAKCSAALASVAAGISKAADGVFKAKKDSAEVGAIKSGLQQCLGKKGIGRLSKLKPGQLSDGNKELIASAIVIIEALRELGNVSLSTGENKALEHAKALVGKEVAEDAVAQAKETIESAKAQVANLKNEQQAKPAQAGTPGATAA